MRAFSLYSGNSEPSVDELLDDPIVALLMERDSVTPGEVRDLMDAAAGWGHGRRRGAPRSAEFPAKREPVKA
jgi:hypothetical protein